MKQENIRNFSIIAHIDHGKSTLADRIIESCTIIQSRDKVDQMLDTMDLEKERGITIKSNAISLTYRAKDGEDYIFNLIDTPGHVDFTYEVSRSLASCDGVLLVIDATQGVEAQTIANMYLALENDLEILPVINKIDMPAADIDRTKKTIENTLGLDPEEAVAVSAKEGLHIDQLLERIVEFIPSPTGDPSAPLQALIFDSYFDQYVGAVAKLRIVEGTIAQDDEIMLMSNNRGFTVNEVGVFGLKAEKRKQLQAGEVGYLIANIKSVTDTKIGDTITHKARPASKALPGFKDAKPMVFAGLYPMFSDDYEELREALQKLQLNDASLLFEPDNSYALGFGFRCGFLGLLHMEIVQERLEREFNISLITTAPSVEYHVRTIQGENLVVDNPVNLPEPGMIDYIEEPFVKTVIITPKDFIGNIMNLTVDCRGIHIDMQYIDENRVEIINEMPLAEIVFNFYDKLKSLSKGYASFDYEFLDHRRSKMVKADILVNGEPVDALSFIVHDEKSYQRGKEIITKLKDIIPKHQFKIPLQAAVGAKIIARETINALRKNVTAKCYGGDISRKRKLLEKQKEGKKRMKQIGSVEIPQEAFLSILRID